MLFTSDMFVGILIRVLGSGLGLRFSVSFSMGCLLTAIMPTKFLDLVGFH